MDQERVGAQLEKILASPQFSQAPRLRRFLEFVIGAAHGGSTESPKEYRIGVEVFDRGKDFDPRIDPIVRVQAAKLRSKLLEYYAGEGASDPIVITIPKGSYAPEFAPRAPAQPTASSTPPPERSRIAVLPLLNLSADPENEYFSDGLTEELINRLACVPGLQVVARTSSFRFKGRDEDIREVGSKLNVGTVMEGSVRRSGDQLRVTAQLIDVQTGYHLFSRTFQRTIKDVFELQDELAQAVVDAIVPTSLGAVRAPGRAGRTANLDAYHAYLKGMFTFSNRFDGLHDCVDQLRHAIALQPDYAPAWAGLAHSYWLLAWYRILPAAEAMPASRDAAMRTLELDADSAQGTSSLGIVESGFEWRWAAGEERFRRAIELQPGLALIYPFYAVVCLLPQLRLDEACAMVRRGLALDPYNPLFHTIATFVYTLARRFDDALLQHALATEVCPGYAPLVASLALVREAQGLVDQAIPGYRKARELTGNPAHLTSFLGHALAISGQRGQARKLLRELTASPLPSALDIVRIHLGLGEVDEALRWLETAVDQRVIHLLTVPADHRFDGIRSHPRFRAIVERMGLPKAHG
ncbi:MAG: hypothetical protein U0610_30690 [bacterium]